MGKILIAFGSTSGNTAEVVGWMKRYLEQAGAEVKAEDCNGLSFDGLCAPYDLVVLGCPTYGVDEVEIQEDFEPLLNALETAGIEGKKVAVFGTGDTAYENFCGAVDVIEERVAACGGALCAESIRIDSPHEDFKAEIRNWCEGVAALA